MDRTLSEYYKTQENLGVLGGGYGGEDLQKQAAAEFLVKLAAEEGVDLGSLPDEEVGQLLAEVEGNMGKQAAAAPQVDETEMQEKLAEADFLGRTMAHAYVDELANIEKQAKPLENPGPSSSPIHLPEHMPRDLKPGLGARTKELASRARGAASGAVSRAGEWTGASGIKGGLHLMRESGAAPQLMHAAGKKQALEGLKRLGKRVGAPLAAGAAIAGLAHHVGKKDSEKKSFDEQFEAAALERAQQMLAEAGYEKQAAPDVNTMIETRALQMLEENGYPVEWNQ